MTQAKAYAKVNLGLVVGPRRPDGKHELATILQRVDLHDDIALEPADELLVDGFGADTIVRRALTALAEASGTEPRWRVRIEKRIPVAAGLGGGSSDAAAALGLANARLRDPLPFEALHRVAAQVGADVPFFLHEGPRLATGDGTDLEPVQLPTGYHTVLLVPEGVVKQSTADVYESFDARAGAEGFDERATSFRKAISSIATVRDLAALPGNDLVSSSFAAALRDAGAFRADVSGAGPTVYGLFDDVVAAANAARALESAGRTYLTRPVSEGIPP